MRLLLLIILIFFPCLSFGQDSLQIDTTFKTLISKELDTFISDSNSPVLNALKVKTKKHKKKVNKNVIKEEPKAITKESTKKVETTGNGNGPIIIGIISITLIVFSVFYFSTFGKSETKNTSSSKYEEIISDNLSRLLLPRREYYRNVYLKSEAWMRKRYVVLKRDNWQCVYCGGRATEVHHTRYAKRNIGKEPIEWLVSVCRTCHDSKH